MKVDDTRFAIFLSGWRVFYKNEKNYLVADKIRELIDILGYLVKDGKGNYTLVPHDQKS